MSAKGKEEEPQPDDAIVQEIATSDERNGGEYLLTTVPGDREIIKVADFPFTGSIFEISKDGIGIFSEGSTTYNETSSAHLEWVIPRFSNVIPEGNNVFYVC